MTIVVNWFGVDKDSELAGLFREIEASPKVNPTPETSYSVIDDENIG